MKKISYLMSLLIISMIFISSANALELEDTNDFNQDIDLSKNHEKGILSSDETINESSNNLEATNSSKTPTDIQISYQDNLYVGDINRITVYNLPNDTAGKVLLYDSNNNKNYSIKLVNGRGSLDLKMKLSSGIGDLGPELNNYYIEAYFEGDDKYESSNTDAFFRVNKYYPNMQMHYKDVKAGQDLEIKFTFEKDATGTLELNVNDKHYQANIIKGMASIVIHGLTKGKYNLSAAYFGDEKYDWDYASGILTVYGDYPINQKSDSVDKNIIPLSDYPTGNPLIPLLFSLLTVFISFKVRD